MASGPRRRVASLLVVAALLVAGCGDDDDPPTSTSTSTTSTSVEDTTSTSSTSTTGGPTTTSTATTGPVGTVPTAVTTVDAGAGGGSGEIRVTWEAVADATGYRVHRADAPAGPFSIAAEIDVVTGVTTLGDGVTNLWSPPSSPQEFEYIEVGGALQRWFRVTAYNDAGESDPSVVVCGAPVGQPDC